MTARDIAIAVLTFRPDPEQVRFYEGFASLGYTVFVFVDDNGFAPPDQASVRYVKLDGQACLRRGYLLLNPMISLKKKVPVSAWEKALFFFGSDPAQFRHVWFFEDDVFIPRAGILAEIDGRHREADLLCRSHHVNHFGETKSWDWWKWVPKEVLPLPWAASMACAVRLSGRLLFEIDRAIAGSAGSMMTLHAMSRRGKGPPKFLFIEFLFNTIALQRKLTVELPFELSHVVFHKRWTLEELDDRHIYHPVKETGAHAAWRSALAERERP